MCVMFVVTLAREEKPHLQYVYEQRQTRVPGKPRSTDNAKAQSATET